MKIGIVTYVKCDNYGAELQAFALQWKLNQLGYNAEVVNLEKKDIDMKKNPFVIKGAILRRLKNDGIFSALKSIFQKALDTKKKLEDQEAFRDKMNNKHQLFVDFFDTKVKHSAKYYTLEEISKTSELDYDTYIAGSDQIWNFVHTDRLDVYFLMFANKFHAKKISYAASISIYDIPKKLRPTYKKYIDNIDYLSVRELQGAELIAKRFDRKAEVVLDPTFLLSKQDWMNEVARVPDIKDDYLLVYTLSGSRHIRKLAWDIANKLGLKVVNIKSEFGQEPDDGTINLYEVGPREWVGLWSKAKYIVTDSFHGTAFSINFNVPFTTLVNPVSMMNSRVLSILKITGLENRIIFDNKKALSVPSTLNIDFTPVNNTLNIWRKKSLDFLTTSIKK